MTTSLQFNTFDNNKDPTFNQLLSINDYGHIAGYFGSGQVVNGTLHPNKGYTFTPPYTQYNYHDENFPGSVQTQVTGINNPTARSASGLMPTAITLGSWTTTVSSPTWSTPTHLSQWRVPQA